MHRRTATKPDWDDAALWQVRWTERQAHAFQLLHILPHEMGHHHDRLERTDGGEPFAEAYANRVLDEVRDAYCALFGAP